MKETQRFPLARPLVPLRGLLGAAGVATAMGALAGAQVQVPDLTTYASIDEALAGEVLVGTGSHWRYFIGVEELGVDKAWTKAEYDDSLWREGRANFGYGPGFFATDLAEMEREAASTSYFRYVLEVEDPELYESVELRVAVDDGYIFYLNGTEEDRLHAGIYTAARYNFFASANRDMGMQPTPRQDLTGKLLAGDNQLAVHGLVHKDDRGSFGFDLELRATFNTDPLRERQRFEELSKLIPGARPAARLAYLEGRYLERVGKLDEAARALTRASELDTNAREPLLALEDVHRALGTLDKLDAEWRDLIDSGWSTPALLDVWARLAVEELGRSPAQFPGLLPERTPAPTRGYFADVLWIGDELGAGRPLRINAGAKLPEPLEAAPVSVEEAAPVVDSSAAPPADVVPDPEGDKARPAPTSAEVWSRDRWYRNGQAVALEADGATGVRSTVRKLQRGFLEIGPMYELPLPNGPYTLTLHLEPVGSVDVFAEEALVRRAFDPHAGAEGGGSSLRLPVFVRDGALSFDLLPRTLDTPRLVAFEIAPVDTDAFAELARSWGASPESLPVYSKLQLAALSEHDGDPRAAIAHLEAVERRPGFRPVDEAYLGRLREGLLPAVPSRATADWLVANRDRLDAKSVLAAKAGKGDEARAHAAYLEAKLLLAEGKLDDAAVLFEELSFSEAKSPESFLGMATCLRTAGLGEEAEAILFEAVQDGLALSDALLLMIISLNMDDMGRDAWETLERISSLDLPDQLVIVPTSETGARFWEYTPIEPTTVTWSRTAYDASWWERGPGGIGNGLTRMSNIGSLWDGQVLFARTPFTVPTDRLPYPYVSVSVNDAGDVYLNGTQVNRIGYRTVGYLELPIQKGNFQRGDNFVGIYAYNTSGPGFADVGIVLPLADLAFLRSTLVEDGVLRINCGGDEVVDTQGRTWAADRFYGHRQPMRAPLIGNQKAIAGTEDDELYRTHASYERGSSNDDGYRIPVPDGEYHVTLHFAEIDPEVTDGKRIFDVQLETTTVLDKLHLVRDVGHDVAVVHGFDVRVTDGWLDLDFVRYIDRGNPILSGLEIERR